MIRERVHGKGRIKRGGWKTLCVPHTFHHGFSTLLNVIRHYEYSWIGVKKENDNTTERRRIFRFEIKLSKRKHVDDNSYRFKIS